VSGRSSASCLIVATTKAQQHHHSCCCQQQLYESSSSTDVAALLGVTRVSGAHAFLPGLKKSRNAFSCTASSVFQGPSAFHCMASLHATCLWLSLSWLVHVVLQRALQPSVLYTRPPWARNICVLRV
jgi:hypothetical protein